MFHLEEELKKLPKQPGVYLMHSSNDEVIYVGKAINLKNRVRQYFQTSRTRSAKIEKMVSLISYFEYIITDSELEALVLESNLIKEYKPKYNTMLTDDKNYPFIKVTLGEAYPRVVLARQMKRDKSKYFGPFTSGKAVKDTIELLRKLYCLRTCDQGTFHAAAKDRPCLYYQIKQCHAPCQGYISKEEYDEQIRKAMEFLNGNTKEIRDELTKKMQRAAEEFEFEQAAVYRDLLASIQHITQDRQRITDGDQKERDIIAVSTELDEAVVSIFFVREGKILGREHFHMTGVQGEAYSTVLTEFVKQYYAGTPYIPKELLLEYPIDDMELIEEWLSTKRDKKVHIHVPQKGEKHKLIALAKENASMVLRQDLEKLKREEARTIGAVNEITQMLGIPSAGRIEAFDISNISGYDAVASMVVFEQGKAKRSDYRKFRLRTVQGPDDYKSMEEVLTRRFTHGLKEQEDAESEFGSFNRFPDLIMMDGGRGQINVALRVLESLQLSIPVCGMVKDDKHRTRGLYYQNQMVEFPKNGTSFDLVTRIQDEAHRFAITYHKNLRGKTQVKSVLDDIKGVGPARRKNLMKHFKELSKIKEASIEELMKVEGITKEVAHEIYNHFR